MPFDLMQVGGVGFGPTVSVSGGEPALPPPPPVVFGVVVCVDEVGLGAVGENLLLSTGAILMMPLTIDGCKRTKRRISTK